MSRQRANFADIAKLPLVRNWGVQNVPEIALAIIATVVLLLRGGALQALLYHL